MKNSIYRNTCLLLAVSSMLGACMSYAPDEAGAEEFRSAQVTGRRSSLENQIRFPRYEGDINIVLNCYALVTRSDEVLVRFCDSEHEDRKEFIRAVYNASPTARATAAKLGNAEEDAQIMMAVRFVKDGGDESIEVFNHHLDEGQPTDEDYIAPQRAVINTSRWNFNTSACASQTFAHWMDVRVSVDGKPLEISLNSRDEGANDECIEFTRNYLSNQSYLPAVRDGEYVEATYTEIFNEGFRRVFDLN